MGDAIAACYGRGFAVIFVVLLVAGGMIVKGCDFVVSRLPSSREQFEREAIKNGVAGRRGNGAFAWVDIAEETRLSYKRGFEIGRKSVFSEMRESGNLEPVPRIPAE